MIAGPNGAGKVITRKNIQSQLDIEDEAIWNKIQMDADVKI